MKSLMGNMRYLGLFLVLLMLGLGALNIGYAQTQRNPVLEFGTGTW